jgi:hypothetical protein
MLKTSDGDPASGLASASSFPRCPSNARGPAEHIVEIEAENLQLGSDATAS